MKNTTAKLTAILLSLGVTAQAGEVVPGDIFAAINLRDIDAITRMLGDDKAKYLNTAETARFVNELNALIDETTALYNQRVGAAKAAAKRKE